jgi:hypothetical protein
MKKIILLMLFFVCGFSLVIYANQNEDDAKQYCKDVMSKTPGYKCKVSKWRGCGLGWTMDKAFRKKGKDYYACKQTKAQIIKEENKKKAEADCEKIRQEGKICQVKRSPCGVGWLMVKRYSGPGRDFVVCERNNSGFTDIIVHKSNPDKKEKERKAGDANKKTK